MLLFCVSKRSRILLRKLVTNCRLWFGLAGHMRGLQFEPWFVLCSQRQFHFLHFAYIHTIWICEFVRISQFGVSRATHYLMIRSFSRREQETVHYLPLFLQKTLEHVTTGSDVTWGVLFTPTSRHMASSFWLHDGWSEPCAVQNMFPTCRGLALVLF